MWENHKTENEQSVKRKGVTFFCCGWANGNGVCLVHAT